MNTAKIDAKRNKSRSEWASRIAKCGAIRCHYCGIGLSRESATREHIKPQASGGSDQYKNTVIACKRCNNSRSSKPYAEFKAMMLPIKRTNLAKRNGRREP